ncbi:MAG: TatD family hydrolase [Bacteroidota bacterium]|nr:TatD family hydrolase [Bacteroidota bacterium]
MQLIDTHTHIYLPEFDRDRDEAISRAVQTGVVKLLMPNIDLESVGKMLSVETRYPGICYPMIGFHPTSVKENPEPELEKILSFADDHKFYAIGEIGIDMYWDQSRLKEQISIFKKQVAFALKVNLPVVIHSRNSFGEIFEALSEFIGSGIKGVFHAFTGSYTEAEKAIGIGFRLGIGGIITFRNSGLGQIVKEAGIENVILETDSPYLAPVPFRGKRNESSYICIINDKIADIFGLSKEEAAAITFKNSVQLFGI